MLKQTLFFRVRHSLLRGTISTICQVGETLILKITRHLIEDYKCNPVGVLVIIAVAEIPTSPAETNNSAYAMKKMTWPRPGVTQN